jgi:hypothetical protein
VGFVVAPADGAVAEMLAGRAAGIAVTAGVVAGAVEEGVDVVTVAGVGDGAGADRVDVPSSQPVPRNATVTTRANGGRRQFIGGSFRRCDLLPAGSVDRSSAAARRAAVSFRLRLARRGVETARIGRLRG